MGKPLYRILAAALLGALLAGCGGDTVATVQTSGCKIVPGQTLVSELLDGGFELGEPPVGDSAILPAASLTNLVYYLERDGQPYLGVAVFNDSGTDQILQNCKIHTVVYKMYNSQGDAYPDAVIGGVDYRGHTREDVLDAMEGAELLEDGGTQLVLWRGNLEYRFVLGEDGQANLVRVSLPSLPYGGRS